MEPKSSFSVKCRYCNPFLCPKVPKLIPPNISSCRILQILTNTLFSVLSPFVSSFTTYLTRIFVWRPRSVLTLSVKDIIKSHNQFRPTKRVIIIKYTWFEIIKRQSRRLRCYLKLHHSQLFNSNCNQTNKRSIAERKGELHPQKHSFVCILDNLEQHIIIEVLITIMSFWDTHSKGFLSLNCGKLKIALKIRKIFRIIQNW